MKHSESSQSETQGRKVFVYFCRVPHKGSNSRKVANCSSTVSRLLTKAYEFAFGRFLPGRADFSSTS